MKTKIILGTFFAIASFSAHSASLYCSGEVEELAYHGNNKLMIKLSSMNRPVFFCSPDAEWTVPGTGYKTGKETCKTLYSTFLSAKISKTPIKTMLFDGDAVPATCSAWEPWKAASIRYYVI